tara:strand:+ start:47 stop:613 length:567 start_codon:yes stop_codon:yes gene_type:complete
MNILDTFATPIGIEKNFTTESQRINLYDKIKNIPHEKHEAISGNGVSTHKKQMLSILDSDLKIKLQNCIENYMNKFGIDTKLRLTHMWTNIQNKGSVLKKHIHGKSILSGAIYINVESNSTIHFHNPNPLMVFTEKADTSPYSDIIKINVENNMMIIFPSWLSHGNDNEINHMNDRIVISFNLAYEYD